MSALNSPFQGDVNKVCILYLQPWAQVLENFRPFPPIQCCLKYCGRSIQLSFPTLNGARGKFPRQNVQRRNLGHKC